MGYCSSTFWTAVESINFSMAYGFPRASQRAGAVAEQDMDCCSASSMPDQHENRVCVMLKENRSLRSESKEAKMLEKYPSTVLEPNHAEAAPKEIRGRPFERGNPGRPRGSKNRTTRLLEELVAGEGRNWLKKLLSSPWGNVKCLQMCLDRLCRDAPADRSTSRCRQSTTRAMSWQRWPRSPPPMAIQKLSRHMTSPPALRRLNRS
jgi:hypothetical protein